MVNTQTSNSLSPYRLITVIEPCFCSDSVYFHISCIGRRLCAASIHAFMKLGMLYYLQGRHAHLSCMNDFRANLCFPGFPAAVALVCVLRARFIGLQAAASSSFLPPPLPACHFFSPFSLEHISTTLDIVSALLTVYDICRPYRSRLTFMPFSRRSHSCYPPPTHFSYSL